MTEFREAAKMCKRFRSTSIIRPEEFAKYWKWRGLSAESGEIYESISVLNRRSDVRAAAKAVYAPKWIACKDRYPPDSGNVLVYTLFGSLNVSGVTIASWHSDCSGWSMEDFLLRRDGTGNNITHWQSLPEPPEEVNV